MILNFHFSAEEDTRVLQEGTWADSFMEKLKEEQQIDQLVELTWQKIMESGQELAEQVSSKHL